MHIIVTGGAGYIGSVATDHLLKAGHQVTVIDNLVSGHQAAIPPGAAFINSDIANISKIKQVFEQPIDAVMHFAAFIQAGESMQQPHKYFHNNTAKSMQFFDLAVKSGVKHIVFSSTAAVHASQTHPLKESDQIKPANFYGQTKLMVEQMLNWYHRLFDVNVSLMRYFNASGASLINGDIPQRGEAHQPETHLIPLILEVATGDRDKINIFGNDYDTPDGTCIRDYIHVDDLAHAHILALQAMSQDKLAFEAFNLGNGQGFSNLEVLETARKVTEHPIPADITDRRPGDPAKLIASSQKAHAQLGWQPKHQDLEPIIKSAWAWHKHHPHGYQQ